MKKNVIEKNLIVGVSFVIALILLYFGVNFLKGVNVFKKRNVYPVLFEDVTDLHPSSPVYVNGYQIGLVSSVKIHKSHPISFLVEVNMERGYKVPRGSRLEFNSDFLGASSVNLIPGDPSGGFLLLGDTLYGSRKVDILSNIENLLPRADTLFQHVDSVLVLAHGLLKRPELIQIIIDIEKTVSELNSSSQGMSRLINEVGGNMPQITQNIERITEELTKVVGDLASIEINETFDILNALLVDIHKLSVALNENDTSIGKLIHSPELHDSLTHMISNVSLLLDQIRSDPKKYLTVKMKLF